MTQRRLGHSADRLETHIILIAGNTTADFYDPVTEIINRTVSISAPRFYFSSTTIEVNATMNVLLSGGIAIDTGTTYLPTLDVYNNEIKTFNLTRMSFARYYHTVTLLPNGNVIIAGGSPVRPTILDTLEMYNSSSNTFMNLTARMSSIRYYHTATYIASIQSILFAGGSSTTSNSLNTYDLFNITTLKFVRNGTMLQSRTAHTATLLNNGQVLLVGNDPESKTPELFDPTTFTFRWAANQSVARGYHTATLLGNSGQVLICGGDASSVTLNSCEIYYP
ncbi:hypothetical protein I4U23_022355 [Adineta vaga]|nr:hypothetical protein I4U23_022355 [Adineta vaga]